MVKIRISDRTLCRKDSGFSFKEKIEIARQLEKLCVSAIEIPEIENEKTDILFVKTVSSFVKGSIISVAAGSSKKSIENALQAVSAAENARIRIEVPVSAVKMEYEMHKKAPKMLEWIKQCIEQAKQNCSDVEFCALDSTRADKDFLIETVKTAEQSGATGITLCDNAGEMFPDDFANFVAQVMEKTDLPVSVMCENGNSFANAAAALCIKKGVKGVKTSVCGGEISLKEFALMIENCGEKYGYFSDIKNTQLNRIAEQIKNIVNKSNSEKSVVTVSVADESVKLEKSAPLNVVLGAVSKLGYDLSEDDKQKVYEEFLRVADKKPVGTKELDAIVASAALQVPQTYKLVSYLINNGNIISSNAQITLEKDGKVMRDVCIGDGPIDAAFLAVDKIVGRHFELDDFQIQSVTEGTEAMGYAVVKLRAEGRLYSGNGISTDIIGASIRAYLNAVNKIVYEEA